MTTQLTLYRRSGPFDDRSMRELLLAPPAILRNPLPAATRRPNRSDAGAYVLLAAMSLWLAVTIAAAHVLPLAAAMPDVFGP